MTQTDPHRSLSRALDILELRSSSPGGYTLSQLSVRLSISKGSISPLLHTLRQFKALYYDGLYPLTEHTITDFHALADQLAEVRRTGFAFECEESTRGIRCIAVPLRKDGQVAAALSVAFPLNRYLPDRVERARSALNQARHQIEALMRGVDIQFYSNPTNYREYPQEWNQPAQSCGVMVSKACLTASGRSWASRTFFFLKKALSFDHIFSIGFKSGL